MEVTALSALDLSLAAGLVIILAFLSYRMELGLGKQMILAGARMTVQLLLIGLVLQSLFASRSPFLISVVASVMLLAAGREVRVRLKRRIKGFFGFGVGVGALFISSFSITLLALVVILQQDPWYEPRYAIPFLGMLLGNTMTGVALASDRMTSSFYEQREIIEQRLMLGEPWYLAVSDIRRESMRSGMIPMINAMAAAGLVSLPGMMTGQILGGSPPIEAVKYQLLIMFLICAGSGFGILCSIKLIERHLFDSRHRLRLDRIDSGSS